MVPQNKEAEAKEELKRRAKQLEHQRREQQRIQRAQPSYPSNSGGGYPSNTYGGMAGGYSAAPTIERDYTSSPRTASPAFSSAAPAKAPAFKGTGMKLGAKRGARGRDELIEAMGGEAEEPVYVQEREPEREAHEVVKADEHVLPEVEKERYASRRLV